MDQPQTVPTLIGGDRSPVADHAWPGIAARLKLTDRETAIIRGLFHRMNETAIASALGISRNSVKTHLSRGSRALERALGGDPDPERATS